MTAIADNRSNGAPWLLANREHLSLSRATNYLVGRMRIRTPLGAAEFLGLMGSTEGHSPSERREAFDQRNQLALTEMEIYRALFPLEYRASQSPAYSLGREHELYRLIAAKLFPLDEELMSIATIGGFLPAIPVQGTQQHHWERGCCAFEQLQTVFKLALVLSGRKGPKAWRLLPLDVEPVAPLGAEAWTLFAYSLAIESTPLRYLIRAFNVICYATGNPWLDAPNDACLMLPWSLENVMMLWAQCVAAKEYSRSVIELDQWLDEEPRARLSRAVWLWNDAEKQAGEGARLARRR